MEDKDYPSIKEALSGDSPAANLYCGIKYIFWNASFAILAVFSLALFAIFAPIKFIVGKLSDNEYIARTIVALLDSRTMKAMSRIFMTFIVVGFFGTIVFIIGAMIIADPVAFAIAVGYLSIGIGTIFAVVVINDKYGLTERTTRASGAVKNKSKETPILRRVLGYCPVSMDIEPKWYDALVEKLWREENR